MSYVLDVPNALNNLELLITKASMKFDSVPFVLTEALYIVTSKEVTVHNIEDS